MDKSFNPKRFFAVTHLLMLLAMGLSVNSWAQETRPEINITIHVMKEVRTVRDGKWTVDRVPVQSTQPGDILVYALTYSNSGETVARDVSVVDPLPGGTEYILDSAEVDDAEVLYSIDGGFSYQRPPITYEARKEDGTEETVAAPPHMYTHIKWLILSPIPPGASGRLSFKVKVQ